MYSRGLQGVNGLSVLASGAACACETAGRRTISREQPCPIHCGCARAKTDGLLQLHGDRIRAFREAGSRARPTAVVVEEPALAASVVGMWTIRMELGRVWYCKRGEQERAPGLVA